jgi:hypothetical protein
MSKPKTLEQRSAEAKPADIEANLVLVSYSKRKSTKKSPGYKLNFKAPLAATEVGRDDEAEIKKALYGVLKITSRNLFEGPRTVSLTGLLERKFVAALGDNQAYQVWGFTLSARPNTKNGDAVNELELLHELSEADGDDINAAVEAQFFVHQRAADDPKPEPKGPELFSEEEAEIERIKNGNVKIDDEAPGEFDQGADANIREGSDADEARKNRKRKVTA